MPMVDFDVRTVPDIIEAQLTLSYSRLSDIIRVIIDQGNGHEDDIEEVRKSVVTLTKNCERLQGEVDELRTKASDRDVLADTVEDLRKAVTELTKNMEDLTKKQVEDSAVCREAEKRFESRMDATTATLQQLEGQVDRNASQLDRLEKSLAAVQAFTDLWNGSPERMSVLSQRNHKNPSQFEHDIDQRAEYVLSLPPFEKLRDELQVIRLMMNTQATDSIKMKADRSASDTRGTLAEVQETLQGLNRRLRTLEDVAAAKPEVSTTKVIPSAKPKGMSTSNQDESLVASSLASTDRKSSDGDAAFSRIVADLASRMSSLEAAMSRLRTSLSEKVMPMSKNDPPPQTNGTTLGPESLNSVHSSTIVYRKDSQKMEQNSLPNIKGPVEGNADLAHRVEELEVVAGLLEANKADRRELYALEDALNQMLQRDNQVLASRRPSSAKLPYIHQNTAPRVGSNPLLESPIATHEGVTHSFARSSMYGRPLFVSNSSVNLRDGVQSTSATITPVQR